MGVILDQFLNLQCEVKITFKKMACGIKILQSIKKPLTIINLILLLNALVISHLNYPAILLSSLTSSLIKLLKKQLSWAIKTCCD